MKKQKKSKTRIRDSYGSVSQAEQEKQMGSTPSEPIKMYGSSTAEEARSLHAPDDSYNP